MADTTTPPTLPTGLIYHCEQCNIVIPSDAPQPSGGNCAAVAAAKVTWDNPDQTLAGRYISAVSAWSLIYAAALRNDGDAASIAYQKSYRTSLKALFQSSALRKAMTDTQVQTDKSNPIYGKTFSWMYA